MDLLAHFAVGIWLYTKIENIAVPFLSCILDIDHILGYIYDKIEGRKKEIHYEKIFEEFFKTRKKRIFLRLSYRPRTWIHSFFGVFLIGLFLTPFFGLEASFIPLISHILLDALDKNGVFLFPPLIKSKIRGALPVGYLAENPNYLIRHKRSHVPSLILIIIVTILILYKI
ncbi:MAG: metal-dependent hydrolase [Candidatus Aenigmatarchaeota archaeon]